MRRRWCCVLDVSLTGHCCFWCGVRCSDVCYSVVLPLLHDDVVDVLFSIIRPSPAHLHTWQRARSPVLGETRWYTHATHTLVIEYGETPALAKNPAKIILLFNRLACEFVSFIAGKCLPPWSPVENFSCDLVLCVCVCWGSLDCVVTPHIVSLQHYHHHH